MSRHPCGPVERLYWPLPTRHGADVQQIAAGLRELSPASPALARWDAATTAARASMAEVMTVDYSALPIGSTVAGWTSVFNDATPAIGANPTGLRLASTFEDGEELRAAVAPGDDYQTVVMTFTITIAGDGPLDAGIGLLNANIMTELTVTGDQVLILDGSANDRYRDTGHTVRSGDRIDGELRYHRHLRTADLLIDGRFAAEAVPVRGDGDPAAIRLRAGAGTVVTLEQLSLRTTALPWSVDMGAPIPIIEADELSLRPTGHIATATGHFDAADVDGDGRLEVLASPFTAMADVSIYRVELSPFRQQRLTDVKLSPGRPGYFGGLIGRYLAIYLPLPGYEHNPDPGPMELNLVALDSQWTPRIAMHQEFPSFSHCRVTPYRLGPGVDGFAASFEWPMRGIALFAPSDGGDSPYRHTGFYRLLGDAASDLIDLEAIDLDGDTRDELLLSWGPWTRYRPAVWSPGSQEPPTPLIDRPLGLSYLAVAGRHVLCTTRRVRDADGAIIPGHGVRLFRNDSASLVLIHEQPGDAFGAVAGRIAGQDVFAYAEFLETTAPGRVDLRIRVVTVRDGQLAALWSATYPDWPRTEPITGHLTRPQLRLADLDLDGHDELLIGLDHETGITSLTLSPTY